MKTGTKIGIGIAVGGLAALGIGIAVAVKRKNETGLGRPSKIKVTKKDGMTVTHYRGKLPIGERVGLIQDLVFQGVQDPAMRKLALSITKNCPARDGKCEANAIDLWVRQNIRYTGDIGPVKLGRHGPVEAIDLFQHPKRTVEFKGGDCLPIETLVLRDDYQLVPIIELDPGDRIMGDGGWTVVQDRWATGEKPLLAFELSNGCVLRLTAEHRIFRDVAGNVEEIRAGEAKVGDDLIMPESIPFAAQSAIEWPTVFAGLTSEERAWLLGVYTADGWSDGKTRKDGSYAPYRASISGLDGKVKEEQKRRVQAMMERIGVHTRWHEKYIVMNDSSIARFFAPIGARAYEKALPNLTPTSEADVRALIEGLAADADQRDGVFGTTSPTLALQLRVLHRMIGLSVGIRRVDDHGGFGKHPIYRVSPHHPGDVTRNVRRDIKFARIRSIREDGTGLCADLTTDTGRFWLPESDVLVHNCDDHSGLASTLLAQNGFTAKLRVTSPSLFGEGWSHIYVVAGLPKERPTQWIVLDSTLPNGKLGAEHSSAKRRDFASGAPAFVKEFDA